MKFAFQTWLIKGKTKNYQIMFDYLMVLHFLGNKKLNF